MSIEIGDDLRKLMDSGIEWIGEIPVGWTVKPLKRMAKFGKGLPITKDDLIEQGVPVVSYGQIHSKTNNGTHLQDDLIRFVSETYLESNLLSLGKKGDIFFADTSEDYAGIGNAVLVDIDIPVFAGYHTVIVRPDDQLYSRYLAYLFLTDAWRNQLCSRASGIKVFSITQGLLKKTTVILPPAEKAVAMTDYLDRKCSQIDAIIARQQEVIEKLKAYKLSVITEAVTKGVNPNVPMKDSRVEWIGEIPEHWTISALRYGLENIQTGPFGSQLHAEDYIEDGIFVINPANIIEGRIVPDNRCSVTELKSQELSRHILNKGDIIFARRGEMGRCAYFGGGFQQYLCGTGCIKIQCNANLMPEFISWLLQTSCVKQYLTLNSVGTTMANLNTTIISSIPVVFPPISEQEKVVEYIKNKICEIDCVLKNKLSIVEKLTEYKKSLIYEVVTGKKEV